MSSQCQAGERSADELISRGICPVKKEYLQHRIAASQPAAPERDVVSKDKKSRKREKQVWHRDRLKQFQCAISASKRMNFALFVRCRAGYETCLQHAIMLDSLGCLQDRAADARTQLCYFFLEGKCTAGTACRHSHDIGAYLESRPPDLPGRCPLSSQAVCPYGIRCRWASKHENPDALTREHLGAAATGADNAGAGACHLSLLASIDCSCAAHHAVTVLLPAVLLLSAISSVVCSKMLSFAAQSSQSNCLSLHQANTVMCNHEPCSAGTRLHTMRLRDRWAAMQMTPPCCCRCQTPLQQRATTCSRQCAHSCASASTTSLEPMRLCTSLGCRTRSPKSIDISKSATPKMLSKLRPVSMGKQRKARQSKPSAQMTPH